VIVVIARGWYKVRSGEEWQCDAWMVPFIKWKLLSNCFIPKSDAVFCGKACGIIEFSSPTERIHIALFNTLFFAAEHNSVHHRFADAPALIFFSGANRFYQCSIRLPVNIDETVSTYIIFLLRVFVNYNTFESKSRSVKPSRARLHRSLALQWVRIPIL